jgi:hypothetical protein
VSRFITRFLRSIHDYEPVPKINASATQNLTSPPGLPPKPISQQEENRKRNYFPVSWRVIGGGVLIGDPSRKRNLAALPRGRHTTYIFIQMPQGRRVEAHLDGPMVLKGTIAKYTQMNSSMPILVQPRRNLPVRASNLRDAPDRHPFLLPHAQLKST